MRTQGLLNVVQAHIKTLHLIRSIEVEIVSIFYENPTLKRLKLTACSANKSYASIAFSMTAIKTTK
jgi:hypothetical protein